MLAIEGTKELISQPALQVPQSVPLVVRPQPTVVEPDDIQANLFQLGKTRQLSPQEQAYLQSQNRYMDFVVGSLKRVAHIYDQIKFVPATYHSLGNLAEAYVQDIPYLKAMVQRSEINAIAVLTNMEQMARMMNDTVIAREAQKSDQLALMKSSAAANQSLAVVETGVRELGTMVSNRFSNISTGQKMLVDVTTAMDKTLTTLDSGVRELGTAMTVGFSGFSADRLALVKASEATNQSLVTLDSGVRELGVMLKSEYSKFSADQLAKYQQVLNSLVDYNGSFHQMSASFQALVAKQQQDQDALAITVQNLQVLEKSFPAALQDYLDSQKDIASTAFDENRQKAMVSQLKQAFNKAQQFGNNQIAGLRSVVESQNLKLEEMKKEMMKFQQMVVSTQGSTKQLEKSNQALIVYEENNKQLVKKLETMQTTMNAAIEKAIISRDAGQPALMTLEEGRKMQDGFNLSITNAIKSIHNEYNSTTNVSKEEFNILMQKITNISVQMTAVTNTINNNVVAVVNQPSTVIAAASPAPPPIAPIDYRQISEAVALSFEKQLPEMISRDPALTRLVNTIGTSFSSFATAIDRSNAAVLGLVQQQLNMTQENLTAMVREFNAARVQAPPATLVEARRRRGDFQGPIPSIARLPYFKPYELDLMNRPGPLDRFPGVRQLKSQAAAKGRPNKKHGMAQVRSREPDPFVDPEYHVRKIRTQKARKATKTMARRAKLGHSKRNDYLF